MVDYLVKVPRLPSAITCLSSSAPSSATFFRRAIPPLTLTQHLPPAGAGSDPDCIYEKAAALVDAAVNGPTLTSTADAK
eukprot:8786116-Pyramimonas_sp.AAC.1